MTVDEWPTFVCSFQECHTFSDFVRRQKSMTQKHLRLISSPTQSVVKADQDNFGVQLGVLLDGDSEKNIFKILSGTIEAGNGI